jgi:hypothetical protein
MTVLADVRRVIADRIVDAGIDSSINVFAYPPKEYPLPAVLVLPASDTYVNYHGTFGASRLMEVNLIVRVMVPLAGSHQSGVEYLDSFLSSGTDEDLGLADAISGADVTIGSVAADIYVSSAVDFAVGQLELAQTTPVVSCDLPVIVRIKRS